MDKDAELGIHDLQGTHDGLVGIQHAEPQLALEAPPAEYVFHLADKNWVVKFKTPANRLQRFLQLLVGIQWERS